MTFTFFSTLLGVVCLYGLFQGCPVAGQELCKGPIYLGEVVNISAIPDHRDAKRIDIAIRSEYELDLRMTLDIGKQILYKDDGSGIKASKSREGEVTVFSIESDGILDASTLTLELVTKHPCNSIAILMEFDFLLLLFEEGIPFPTVATMPKKGYRLDKEKLFQLKFGLTYKNDSLLAPRLRSRSFVPKLRYHWYKTNIMHTLEEVSHHGISPRKAHSRYLNTSCNEYKTTTAMFQLEMGNSFPVDGAVFIPMLTFNIRDEGVSLHDMRVFAMTSVHFTDDPYGLPVSIRSLYPTPDYATQIHQSRKPDGTALLTIGLNFVTPKSMGILTFIAVGVDTAPSLTISRQCSQNPTKMADEQVDFLYPGSQLGSVAFGEFQISHDLPLGEKTHYLFKASTGGNATSVLVEFVSIIPVRVHAEELETDDTNLCQGSCTATGFPPPLLRLFVVPYYDFVYNNWKKVPDEFLKYEVSETPNLINVTSSPDVFFKKTVSFQWDEMEKEYDVRAFYLYCFASNVYQNESTVHYFQSYAFYGKK